MKSRYLLLLIALIFIAHAIFFYFALGAAAVDDAYISFRYAQNAILGYGLTFNPGERVEGYTNFLWTALMVPLEGVGIDLGRASMFLGTLFGLGTLALVYRFGKSLSQSRAVGLLAALLLAVDGSFVLWSVAGLETPLFAFLIFAGAYAYVREQKNAQGFPLSGIFFALSALTRPEGAFVFALTVGHQALSRLLGERKLFVGRDAQRVASFVALFVPYFLARWWYYRSLLPNSFYAKVSVDTPAAQIARGWNHLNQFVGVHLGWGIVLPILLAIGLAVWHYLRSDKSENQQSAISNASPRSEAKADQQSEIVWHSYFALLVTVYVAYIVYVGGDWSVGRFFAPLMPFTYLLIASGLVALYQLLVTRLQTRWLSVASVALVIAFASGLAFDSSWNGEYGIYIRGFDAARATAARVAMGVWLKANVPRGTWIAVDAAGQVPYVSGLPAIDMFGINDVHIAHLKVPTLGEGTPGHEKFDLGYVIARAPRYVIIYGNLLDPVKEYRRLDVAWTQDAGLKQFLTLYELGQ